MSTVLEQLRDSLAGRYRLEQEIGSGGMAAVYRAIDVRHDRPVAIKVLNPELAAGIGPDRFLREIEIAARLSHPHILPLFDSGGEGLLLYYVMPLVSGGSLRTLLQQHGRLSIEESLRLAREIASALGHAHAQGLVHRDIKPENILLAEGIALVADFGIARAVSPQTIEPDAALQAETVVALTMRGAMIGTPRYMSPEQGVGGEVDGRTDLYALACVLYEMLAGQPPFTAPTVQGLIKQHLTENPAPVTKHRPDVPAGVAAALVRALAKEPGDRYETAAGFAEALRFGATMTTTTLTAIPAQPATPNNLPRSRTHFIGRERELTECVELLAETRLLTLIGVGGCGKTRLALRLGEQSLERFPDGVWFADLGPVADADRVAQTVASTLGVREQPGVPILETLASRLESSRTLIVLDNCEHLLSACSELVDLLLTRSTELRIVATSREALGVEGERPVGVRSLSVPDSAASSGLKGVQESEAVRLFVDRARVVASDFELTDQNASVIAEICRRLDGIPLAIEFAAARVELLSVEQIRAKLDDRFRLLTGGSRALPRHQTLRATIQWSYDHLVPEEQQLFRLFSVFSGGWTLAGATATMPAGADEFEVLDLLGRLVHKSLVVVVREGRHEPRYRMLETVRQYAQERLDESGEADAARTRHLDFYLSFVDEVGLKLVGPEQAECLRRLDRDLENLLAAHAWCNRIPDGGLKGLELLKGLPLYWSDRGLLALGIKVFREALARPGAVGPLRARVLAAAGSLAFRQGLYDEARQHAEESLAIAKELGDRDRAQFALHLLGAVFHSHGNLEEAARRYEEGLGIARQTADPSALSDLLNALAMVRHTQGDIDSAAGYYRESLQIKRGMGNVRDVGIVSLNLAQLELQRGGLEMARLSVIESLPFVEETGSRVSGRTLIDTAAGVAAAEGDWLRAARLFGAADAALAWAEAPRDPGDEKVIVPMLDRTREALGAATFETAYGAGKRLEYAEGLGEVRQWLAAPAKNDPT